MDFYCSIESVQLILLNNEDKQPSLVSAGQDGLVKYWDLTSIVSQHTYNTQTDDPVKINCIYVDENHIVTVGDDCLVKILDFTP
jgi:WD40 repeat protein